MSRLSRLRPSPAMAVALLALFVALGGSAYAVGSINGAKLKNRSVAGKKLKKHTITGREINFRKLGTVPRATNAAGASNSAALGGKGATSYLSGLDVRMSSTAADNCAPVGAGKDGGCTVPCPPGEFALGGGLDSETVGGYLYSNGPVARSGLAASPGQPAAGWTAGWHNTDTVTRNIRVYVVCAEVGSATTTEVPGLTGIG